MGIKKYLNSIVLEMKKVTWLKKKEAVKSTGLVLIVIFLVISFFYFVDFALMGLSNVSVFD